MKTNIILCDCCGNVVEFNEIKLKDNFEYRIEIGNRVYSTGVLCNECKDQFNSTIEKFMQFKHSSVDNLTIGEKLSNLKEK